MAAEIRRSFPGHPIGGVAEREDPQDLITGLHGAAVIGGIFGMPIRYFPNNWPSAHGATLTDEQADRLAPPDLSGRTSRVFWTRWTRRCGSWGAPKGT